MPDKPTEKEVREGAIQYAQRWGGSPLPPIVLATLVTAQHMRPFQPLPMLFPPVLLFSTYLNLSGYKVDAAGTTAAWSGLYLLLARRRRQTLTAKFDARDIVRGTTLAVCLANLLGGGLTYAFGSRRKEEAERGGVS